MALQGFLFLLSIFFALMVDPAETTGKHSLFFILEQPFLILFGLIFFLASFVGGGSGPNRRSLLYDVNLPEHRGSTGAFFYFTDLLGSVIGLFFGTLLLTQLDYLPVFSFFLLFYFLAAAFWAPAINFANKDSEVLRQEIYSRAEELRTK